MCLKIILLLLSKRHRVRKSLFELKRYLFRYYLWNKYYCKSSIKFISRCFRSNNTLIFRGTSLFESVHYLRTIHNDFIDIEFIKYINNPFEATNKNQSPHYVVRYNISIVRQYSVSIRKILYSIVPKCPTSKRNKSRVFRSKNHGKAFFPALEGYVHTYKIRIMYWLTFRIVPYLTGLLIFLRWCREFFLPNVQYLLSFKYI